MEIAVHAPSRSNQQPYRFLFVDDPAQKQGLADIYRRHGGLRQPARTSAPEDNIDRRTPRRHMTESVMHLAEHIHEVPVLCVPIVAGHTDGFGGARRPHRRVLAASRWAR